MKKKDLLFLFVVVFLLVWINVLANDSEFPLKELTYVSARDTAKSICLVNINERASQPLVTVEEKDVTLQSIKWAPDGGKFVYSKKAGRSSWQVWLSNRDGTDQVKVVENPDYDPVWFPDGTKLLVSEHNNLYIYDTVSNTHAKLDLDESGLVENPGDSWAPDGKRFVAVLRKGGKEAYICSINIETGETVRITQTGGDYYHPVWSPDGEKIAFASGKQWFDLFGREAGLYVMDSDGRNREKIATADNVVKIYWNKDSSALAYSTSRTIQSVSDDGWEQPERIHYELFLYEIGGRRAVSLTDSEECELTPVWSPDGTKLAYRDRRSVYIHSPGKRKPVKIKIPYAYGDPVWAPDSSMIACAGYPGFLARKANIYIAPVNGSTVIKLTGDGSHDLEPVWAPVPPK